MIEIIIIGQPGHVPASLVTVIAAPGQPLIVVDELGFDPYEELAAHWTLRFAKEARNRCNSDPEQPLIVQRPSDFIEHKYLRSLSDLETHIYPSQEELKWQ